MQVLIEKKEVNLLGHLAKDRAEFFKKALSYENIRVEDNSLFKRVKISCEELANKLRNQGGNSVSLSPAEQGLVKELVEQEINTIMNYDCSTAIFEKIVEKIDADD